MATKEVIYVDKDGKRINVHSTFIHNDVIYPGNVLDFPVVVEELGLHEIIVEDVPPADYEGNEGFYNRNPIDVAPYYHYARYPDEVCAAIRQKEVDDAIERAMDEIARQHGYQNTDRCIGYAEESSVPEFQLDGKSLRKFRSLAWKKCYEIIADVKAGNRPLPTVAEVMSELTSFDTIRQEFIDSAQQSV